MTAMDPNSEQLAAPADLPEQIEVPEVGAVETPNTSTPEKARPAQAEQAGTTINRAPAGAPALSLPPIAVPTIGPTPDEPVDDTAAPAAPLIADDVEVIEKEWVDKAREIVRQTKNDPYAQEQAVEALQRAYLKKRYNKDLKSSTSVES